VLPQPPHSPDLAPAFTTVEIKQILGGTEQHSGK